MSVILCVSADANVRSSLADALRSQGFVCATATDLPSALTTLNAGPHAAVVCDVALPGHGAHDVCGQVRQGHGIPVVVVSARPDETEELLAFAAGADDYVAWPGSPRVLIARLRAAMRRAQQSSPASTLKGDRLSFGPVVLTRSTRQVSVDGTPVHLTRTEFDLLALLMESPQVVWNREDLVRAVWSQWLGDDHLLEVHLSRLRAKIGAAGGPPVVYAVRGVGYRLTQRQATSTPASRRGPHGPTGTAGREGSARAPATVGAAGALV